MQKRHNIRNFTPMLKSDLRGIEIFLRFSLFGLPILLKSDLRGIEMQYLRYEFVIRHER